MQTRFALIAILALAVSAGVVRSAEDEQELDVILLTKGTQPPTKVTSENYVNVIGKHKVEIKVSSYLVKEVIYADRDSNYDEGMKKRDEGRWALAALYFTRALQAMGDKKWAPEACNYNIGNVLYQAGFYTGYKGKTNTYAPPSVYFKKVLEVNPKSRYLPEIAWKIAICLAEEGKLDEADAALKDGKDRLDKYREEVIKVAQGYADVADRAQTQLLYAQARVAEQKAQKGKEKLSAVRDLYESLRRKSSKYPEVNAEAVDGLFRILTLMKDYTSVKSEAQTIIDKYNKQNDYTMMPFLPGAYMAMGKALFAQAAENEVRGVKPVANSNYAEARWNFLNVVAEFFDNDDYVAGAHYFAGLCYDKLREVEPKDAGPKAVRHFQLITQNFPKSEYSNMAVTELTRLGVKVETPAPAKPAAATPAQPAPATPAAPKPAPKAPAKK